MCVFVLDFETRAMDLDALGRVKRFTSIQDRIARNNDVEKERRERKRNSLSTSTF